MLQQTLGFTYRAMCRLDIVRGKWSKRGRRTEHTAIDNLPHSVTGTACIVCAFAHSGGQEMLSVRHTDTKSQVMVFKILSRSLNLLRDLPV